MELSERAKENLLCLIAGTIIAVSFIAILVGEGNKGFLELF